MILKPHLPHQGSPQVQLCWQDKYTVFQLQKPNLKWIIDSGATDHISQNLHYFSSYTPLAQGSFITMPNGKQARIHHVGTIRLCPSLTLCTALHILDFHYNLLSASKLAKQLSAYVIFTPTACCLQDPSMKMHLGVGGESSGLYFVDRKSYISSVASSPILISSTLTQPMSQPRTHPSIFSFSCQFSPIGLWHCRLGHMPYDNMKYIEVLSSCIPKPQSICQICPQARQHMSSFPVLLMYFSYI